MVTSQGRHYVCNRVDNRFEPTDGTGYRDWFNEKNRITGGNLKRVCEAASSTCGTTKTTTPPSPSLLTTLAGNTIRPSDEGTEAVSTVADALVTVLTTDGRTTCSTITLYAGDPGIPYCQRRTSIATGTRSQVRQLPDQSQLPCPNGKEAPRLNPSNEAAANTWKKLFGESFGKGLHQRRPCGQLAQDSRQ